MADALHWTYDANFSPTDSLAQGDILARTPELVSLLSQIHKYFADERYLAFLVATQSCDLVKTPSRPCKASHISLAAIRPLDDVLSEYLKENCGSAADSVYVEEMRSKAEMFLERVLNQNESAMGLFYLYPQVEAGIHDHAVARLRVTISFRVDHYEIFRNARVGKLASDFCSKLGWLKGNLYSRVATTDWTETEARKAEYKKLVNELLDHETVLPKRYWLPRAFINQAKTDKVIFDGLTPKECNDEILKHRPKSSQDRAISRVADIAKDVFGKGELDKIHQLTARLENDQQFQKMLQALVVLAVMQGDGNSYALSHGAG